MNNWIMTTITAAIFSAAIMTIPAEARCQNNGGCKTKQLKQKTITNTTKPATRAWGTKQRRMAIKRMKFQVANSRAAPPWGTGRRPAKARIGRYFGAARAHGNVATIIANRAPSFGVPTWFALRIAKVESGYNPAARGAAGEFGVFQLKCATAKVIGFTGDCAGLLNASTNVQFGLKHLSLAIQRSGGNLRMAASKHNGGLGRTRLVTSYVNKVF